MVIGKDTGIERRDVRNETRENVSQGSIQYSVSRRERGVRRELIIRPLRALRPLRDTEY